jgi:nucleoid DNA-binding protein
VNRRELVDAIATRIGHEVHGLDQILGSVTKRTTAVVAKGLEVTVTGFTMFAKRPPAPSEVTDRTATTTATRTAATSAPARTTAAKGPATKVSAKRAAVRTVSAARAATTTSKTADAKVPKAPARTIKKG